MSSLKRWLRSTAHVAGLWALVVASPTLDALARAPEFFTAHRADGADLLAIVFALVGIAPLVAGAIIALAIPAGAIAADLVTAAIVGSLAATYGVQAGYRLGVTTWPPTLAIAAACLVAGALSWWRARVVRFVLTVLAAAALVVPALFFSHAQIRAVFRQSGPTVATRQPSRLPPVVFVLFDELPLVSLLDAQGRIDRGRFPNVAALADDGVWFRNATTVSDFTSWAVPAVLTGHVPRPRTTPTVAHHPDNVFTRLAGTHRMYVVEPWTALCPAALCGASTPSRPVRLRRMAADIRVVVAHVLLPQEARRALPDVTGGFAGFAVEGGGRGAPRTATPTAWARATSFVDGIDARDQPAFYFLHSVIAHHPPTLLPSGQAIANVVSPPGLLPRLVWSTDPWPVTLFHQAALVQAGAVDTLVGRLVARLRATGLYDRAVVVITADHGIAFTPGSPVRDASGPGAAGILPVPFIVKLPASRALRAPGTIDDGNVETIDVVPTIADALGVALEPPVDGVSAFAASGRRPAKQFFFDFARQQRTVDPAAIARLRDRAALRQAEEFGSGPWPSPAPSGLRPLEGRRVSSLTIAAGPPGTRRVEIDHVEAFDDVDPDAAALPAQLTGRVVGDSASTGPPVHLAIALNGTIAATTRTWGSDGRWIALLPPDHLRRGANDVQIFTVDPAHPTTLVPVARSRPRSRP